MFRRQSHQSFHSSFAPSPSLRVTIASVSSRFSPAVINSGPHRVALLTLSSPRSSPFPSACLKPLHLCQPALHLAGHRHTRGRRLTRFPLFSAHQTSSHRSFAQPIVLSSTSNVHVCISLSVLWNASTPSDPSGLIHHGGPCAQMCGVSSSVAHCCISVHFNGDGETKKVFFFAVGSPVL